MDERRQRSMWRAILSICSLALAALVLSACTVGGDDDEGDATEEATETVVAEISTPTSNPGADQLADSTPDVADSTPMVDLSTGASPAIASGSPTPEIVVAAPTVPVPDNASVQDVAQASPEADAGSLVGVLDEVVTGGGGEQPTTDFGASTPVAGPTEAETTVTSCDDVAPPLEDGPASYVTTSDVNFRNGPGTDCDPIFDEPLGEGAIVEVLSEPVVREGDDEYLWVAVSVDGTEGWIATEFIEPAE